MIRKAEARDAEDFCNVIRTSIIELCGLDHKGNKDILDEWLENKTVENCKKWILDECSNSFVAEKNGNIVGISHIGINGYLFLCYVLPCVKGLGIGGKLLSAAETSVTELGLMSISLQSTITAKGFYEHYGYIEDAELKNSLEYCKPIMK